MIRELRMVCFNQVQWCAGIVGMLVYGCLLADSQDKSSWRMRTARHKPSLQNMIAATSDGQENVFTDIPPASEVPKVPVPDVADEPVPQEASSPLPVVSESPDSEENKEPEHNKDETVVLPDDEDDNDAEEDDAHTPYALTEPKAGTEQLQVSAAISEDEPTIEFQFEDADLQNLIKQMSTIYGVTFITDDAIYPLPATGKGVKGNKISFRTQRPLTKKQAWDLFQIFLDVAGLALIPGEEKKVYRIIKTEAARKAALPAFIGVDFTTLPDSDQLVRYLYFLQNGSIQTLKTVIDELRSTASAFIPLLDMNAFILTDKAFNIKSLMNIVSELDRVTLPQAMSVLKLKRANAQDVKNFYESLTKTDDKNIMARLSPARKQPTTLYFPENVRIIAEARTNALILLGASDAIKKIEDFITTYVDVEIGKLYSPLRVYELKYADASTVASIMNDITRFGEGTTVGKAGGVRDGDKYMKSMLFTPEIATNRIIVRGEEDDFQRALDIIKSLDEPQKQVAIEVLILSLNINDNKNVGVQIRSAQPGIDGLVGSNVKYQTSGSRINNLDPGAGIQTRTGDTTGAQRLLGNLITLATGAIPGNTLVTLGSDVYGVWGIFNALQTITNTQIVSNPFLIATNKQQAVVSLGEERRVVSSQVISAASSTNSFANDDAKLSVTITPLINSDGMIQLDLNITIDAFTNQVDLSSGTKTTKNIKTTTIVADKEVLALGGLIKNHVVNSDSKVPLLANIPVIGWLFKNKVKTQSKDNLLILISTRIIKPGATGYGTEFTRAHVDDYVTDREMASYDGSCIDPVYRYLFAQKEGSTEGIIDNFIIDRIVEDEKQEEKETGKKRRARPSQAMQHLEQQLLATPTPAQQPEKKARRGRGVVRRKVDAHKKGKA